MLSASKITKLDIHLSDLNHSVATFSRKLATLNEFVTSLSPHHLPNCLLNLWHSLSLYTIHPGHFSHLLFTCLLIAEQIFAAVLNLYKDENVQSLPNSDEVLVCTTETTSEEVRTLFRYASGSASKVKIHYNYLNFARAEKPLTKLHVYVNFFKIFLSIMRVICVTGLIALLETFW